MHKTFTTRQYASHNVRLTSLHVDGIYVICFVLLFIIIMLDVCCFRIKTSLIRMEES